MNTNSLLLNNIIYYNSLSEGKANRFDRTTF